MTIPDTSPQDYDALVIGGGFYGCAIAVYLATQRKLPRVLLVEQEDALLTRASYTNQARVHNGYHYPRSFTTAYRSRINLPRFVRDWPKAVKQDFIKLYAIARRNSKVTARQFERFCINIGARISPADRELQNLFDSRLIEKVFEVEEFAFDTTHLAAWARRELQEAGVEVHFNSRAVEIHPDKERLIIRLDQKGREDLIRSRYVFNCTYSGLNQLRSTDDLLQTKLKHEITEMALVEMPDCLKHIGITVMDGPFFSAMPFPARGLHTLSHVRYTPHLYWRDDQHINPYEKLKQYHKETRVDRMLRDVTRYVPEVGKARYVESLFEVKTILMKSENDDGRPILYEKHPKLLGYYSILGGKIDNIYDALEKLDMETFVASTPSPDVNNKR